MKEPVSMSSNRTILPSSPPSRSREVSCLSFQEQFEATPVVVCHCPHKLDWVIHPLSVRRTFLFTIYQPFLHGFFHIAKALSFGADLIMTRPCIHLLRECLSIETSFFRKRGVNKTFNYGGVIFSKKYKINPKIFLG